MKSLFRLALTLLTTALPLSSVLSAENDHAAIRIELGQERPVNSLVFGLNLNVKHALEGDLINRAARLARPTVLRYPGGTWSACWDWEQQTIYPQERIWDYMVKKAVWLEWVMPAKELFDRPESKSLTSMKRFVSLAEEIDAELSWVVNFNSAPTENALAMILAARDQGFPVRYIELGNEYNGRSFDQRFRTVRDYLFEASPLIAQIKQHLPDARLAYPSNLPVAGITDADQTEKLEPWQEREHEWDHTLAARTDGVNIVDHHYFGFPPHRRDQEADLLARFEALSLDDQIVYYLLAPQRMHAGMSTYLDDHLAPGKKVWFTEYNMWLHSGPTSELRDSMVNALYLASWKLLLLGDERVEMAHWHSLVGDTFGFIGHDAQNRLTASPVVEVFAELAHVVRNAHIMQALSFPNGPATVNPTAINSSPTFPLLQGVLLTGAENSHLILLNLSPSEQKVSLTELKLPSHSGYSLTAAEPTTPLRRALSPENEHTRSINLLNRQSHAITDGIVLPPFSMTITTSP